ncbi:MAG: hypothetical protein WCI17_08175 [bacterium]
MRQEQLGEAPRFFATARAMADISVDVNRQNPLCSIGRGGACHFCTALREGLAKGCALVGALGRPFLADPVGQECPPYLAVCCRLMMLWIVRHDKKII